VQNQNVKGQEIKFLKVVFQLYLMMTINIICMVDFRVFQRRWKLSSPKVQERPEELLARYLQLLRRHKNKIFISSQREVFEQEELCIQICSKEVETKVLLKKRFHSALLS